MDLTAGSFAVTDWVAPTCLTLLENMLGMTSFANFSTEKEFDREFAVGDTVRAKYPQMFNTVDGPEFQPQAIARQTTNVTVDQWVQLPWGWDAWETALDLERNEAELTANYFSPAMRKMAQEIESRFSRFAFYNTNNVVGAIGTTPTSLDTFGSATTRMIENAGMAASEKYGFFLTPQQQQSAVAASIALFNPSDQVSKAFKKGYIGQYADADWFTSMSLQTFTTGIWATVATGVTVNAAGQSGNSITVACTTGDTFVAGDVISFSTVYNVNPMTLASTNRLKNFKIMVSTTGVGATATLTIYPAIIGPGSPYQNCSNLPGNGDTLTLWPGTTMVNATAKTGVIGQALNDLAFFMAGVKIKKLKSSSVEKFQQVQDKDSGLSLNFVSFSDPKDYTTGNRIDTLFGFGNAFGDRCAVLIPSLY